MENQDEPQNELYDIPGYKDKYSITKNGEVYSHKTKKFLKKGNDTYNYETISLEGTNRKVHRIMAETFLPNPDNLPQVDHLNRNRSDNRIENLKWVSRSDNMKNRTLVPKDPEMRNITKKKSTFKVTIRTDAGNVYKSFKTLEEAKAFRNKIVNEKKQTQEKKDAL